MKDKSAEDRKNPQFCRNDSIFPPRHDQRARLTSPDESKIKVELKRSVRSSNGSVLQAALPLISPCLPLVVTREVRLSSYRAFHVVFRHLVALEDILSGFVQTIWRIVTKKPTLVG